MSDQAEQGVWARALFAAAMDKQREDQHRLDTRVYFDADVVIDAAKVAESIHSDFERHGLEFTGSGRPSREALLEASHLLAQVRFAAGAMWIGSLGCVAYVLPPHLAELKQIIRGSRGVSSQSDKVFLSKLLLDSDSFSSLRRELGRTGSMDDADRLAILRSWLTPSNFVLFQGLFGVGVAGEGDLSQILKASIDDFSRRYPTAESVFSDPMTALFWQAILLRQEAALQGRSRIRLFWPFPTSREKKLSANALSDASALVHIAREMSDSHDQSQNKKIQYRFISNTPAVVASVEDPSVVTWWRATARDRMPVRDVPRERGADQASELPEQDHPNGPIRSATYLAFRCLLPALWFRDRSAKSRSGAPAGLESQTYPLHKLRDIAVAAITKSDTHRDDIAYFSRCFSGRGASLWLATAYAESAVQFREAVQKVSPLIAAHAQGGEVLVHNLRQDDAVEAIESICQEASKQITDIDAAIARRTETPPELVQLARNEPRKFCTLTGLDRWIIDPSDLAEKRKLFADSWLMATLVHTARLQSGEYGEANVASVASAFALDMEDELEKWRSEFVSLAHETGVDGSKLRILALRCLSVASAARHAGPPDSKVLGDLITDGEKICASLASSRDMKHRVAVAVSWAIFYWAHRLAHTLTGRGTKEVYQGPTFQADVTSEPLERAEKLLSEAFSDREKTIHSLPAVRWLIAASTHNWKHLPAPGDLSFQDVQALGPYERQAVAWYVIERARVELTKAKETATRDAMLSNLIVHPYLVGSREQYWEDHLHYVQMRGAQEPKH